ncbi:glycosyltransferase family 4 protein [Methylocaldum sp. MU1018]
MKKTIAFMAVSAGDWGGASRYLSVLIKKLNREVYRPVLLFQKQGPLLEELDDLGIEYVICPEREFGSIGQYGLSVLGAARLFKQKKIDVIHMNYFGWRPAEVIAAKMLGIPVLAHMHVVHTDPPPFLKHVRALIANSEYTKDHSFPQIRGYDKRVVYCSVELERYDRATGIRDELGLSADDMIVSFIGQIKKIKGIDLFIKMADRLKSTRARFLIAGKCRDPDYAEDRLLADISGNERIRYLGYRSDIQNIYKSSDIIVMPSQWDEPFGLINIEAGACRKPIVATRVGGIPEIIGHGENGYLVERDDLDGLVKHTRRLIDDASLRRQLGENGRAVVEARFTDAPVRLLEGIYDEFAEGRT